MTTENSGFAKPLHHPQDAIVDIVFVHGLNGNRQTTWTLGDCFWPKNLLPGDIPKARILTFGYNARLDHFWSLPSEKSHSSIDNHADSLRQDLLNMRTESQTRPIIFVAHSLGGLVCAEALLRAHKTSETNAHSFAERTHGIAFLGTPLQGSSKAKWAEIGQRILFILPDSEKSLVKDLTKSSERLEKLGEDFPQWLRDRAENSASKVLIMCFFEDHDTRLAGLFSSKQIVTKESACLQGYERLGIPADHVGMCKCSGRDDPIYVAIVGKLKEWVAEIKKRDDPKPAETAPRNVANPTFFGINHGSQLGQLISEGSGTFNFGHRYTTSKEDGQQED